MAWYGVDSAVVELSERPSEGALEAVAAVVVAVVVDVEAAAGVLGLTVLATQVGPVVSMLQAPSRADPRSQEPRYPESCP